MSHIKILNSFKVFKLFNLAWHLKFSKYGYYKNKLLNNDINDNYETFLLSVMFLSEAWEVPAFIWAKTILGKNTGLDGTVLVPDVKVLVRLR